MGILFITYESRRAIGTQLTCSLNLGTCLTRTDHNPRDADYLNFTNRALQQVVYQNRELLVETGPECLGPDLTAGIH